MSQAQSVPSAPSADVALTGGALWMAALMLAAANFLAVLNMTIANVAVPNIAGALGAATSQGTWVITAYAVGEAITVPLTGWLSSRFGSVRVFFVSMVLIGVFSVVCGLSTSIGILVVARIFQGLCGGPLMPLSQTLMMRIFPKDKVAVPIGLWSMTTLVAPVVGPILKKIILSRFANTFAMLYASGIPILESIRTTQDVVGNLVVRRGLERVEQLIGEGQNVTAAFHSTGFFPPLVIRMLRVGESTGALDQALINVSYFYNRDVKESVEKMQQLIVPMLTVVLGCMLGWIMLSVLGPVYDVISKIKT